MQHGVALQHGVAVVTRKTRADPQTVAVGGMAEPPLCFDAAAAASEGRVPARVAEPTPTHEESARPPGGEGAGTGTDGDGGSLAERLAEAPDDVVRATSALRHEVERLQLQWVRSGGAARQAAAAAEAARCAAEERLLDALGFTKTKHNVAMVAQYGGGATTLLNSLCGHQPFHPDAAETCVGARATMVSSPHPLPGAEHVILWNGRGGDGRSDLFRQRCLDCFNGVVACFHTRFPEQLAEVVAECHRRRLSTFIVYTNMDNHVRNHQGSFRHITFGAAEESLRGKVSDDVADVLQRVGVPSPFPIYFVDSALMVSVHSPRDAFRYDEKKLLTDLLRCSRRAGGGASTEELYARVVTARQACMEQADATA